MIERFHSLDNDPPPLSRTAREAEQELLDKAIAEFLASGKQVVPIDKKPAEPLSDEDLVKKLVRHAGEGKTLLDAAKQLGESQKRCRDLAVKHRIPFRSKSFLKKRAAK